MTEDEKNGWSEHKLLVTKDIQRLERKTDLLDDSIRAMGIKLVEQTSSLKDDIKEHFDIKIKEVHENLEQRISHTSKRVAEIERKESNKSAVKSFLIGSLGVIATIIGIYIAYHQIKG